MAKRIEYCQMKAGDVKTGFGNPRKISKAKMEELERSLQENGDFGIFLIDEQDNIIGGNQRLKAILKIWGPDTVLDCKRLIGYSKSQLKAINIKDNTHAGEWDLDALADWQADLHLDLGLEMKELAPEERAIPEMELIHYEKYNFVLICCRSELDYNDLIRKLGLEDKKIKIAKTRKIAARAVWYENIANQISEKKEEPADE
jgi:hypothetical protein|nr:MAG TPA: ParB protein [Caudoviricetes sp.]